MPILVGTSGWSYDDWEGAVYPKGMAASERLPFVAEAFPTVEVDSTYYRDPAPAVVAGWIARTRAARRFDMSVKAPQTLTHDLLVSAEPDACARLVASWRALVPQPLHDADRLGAVLLQLSPALTHMRDTQARLRATLEALVPLPVAVEFRHRSWHDAAGARLAQDAIDLLDAFDAAPVLVDGPSFPPIAAGAADHAYVRFHGRNRENWFRRGATRDERYDWDYSDAELAPWTASLAALGREKRVVRVYFNNHVGGQAFRNGHRLETLLSDAGAQVSAQRSPQRRLF